MRADGKIFVISGPSGSGKTTLAQMALKDPELQGLLCRSISFTTRKRRTGERDKRDYFFISEAEFTRKRKAKKILEWTTYLGYYYGTDKGFVEDRLRRFRGIILCLDVAGALRVKHMYPRRAIIIFVKPPSLKELDRRIRARSRSTTDEEIVKRLAVAKDELKAARLYDYRLVNRDLKKAVKRLTAIVRLNLPNNYKD